MGNIPFNRPVFIPDSLGAIRRIVEAEERINIAGDGHYCSLCEKELKDLFRTAVLLTPSCTAALEMAATLIEAGPGDEIILPSFTFVSTALPFESRGARLVFVDVDPTTGNLDPETVRGAIGPKTKAVVAVHYAGNSADMDTLVKYCSDNGVVLIEDAAQSIGAKYRGVQLGTFGALGTLSFHETKNVTAGEGGALIVNDPRYLERARILREKGTNRALFMEGLIDKYSWVDIGSSLILSDLNAAYLYPQLLMLEEINARRCEIVDEYHSSIHLPEGAYFLQKPEYNSSNGHLCAIVCASNVQRQAFIQYMRSRGITTPFHYVALHSSPYIRRKYGTQFDLPSTDRLSQCLVRLPVFWAMSREQVEMVCDSANDLFSHG